MAQARREPEIESDGQGTDAKVAVPAA